MRQTNGMEGNVNEGMEIDHNDVQIHTKPVKQQEEFNNEQDYCRPHESGKNIFQLSFNEYFDINRNFRNVNSGVK